MIDMTDQAIVRGFNATHIILRLSTGGTIRVPLEDRYRTLNIGEPVHIFRTFTQEVVNLIPERDFEEQVGFVAAQIEYRGTIPKEDDDVISRLSSAG